MVVMARSIKPSVLQCWIADHAVADDFFTTSAVMRSYKADMAPPRLRPRRMRQIDSACSENVTDKGVAYNGRLQLPQM